MQSASRSSSHACSRSACWRDDSLSMCSFLRYSTTLVISAVSSGRLFVASCWAMKLNSRPMSVSWVRNGNRILFIGDCCRNIDNNKTYRKMFWHHYFQKNIHNSLPMRTTQLSLEFDLMKSQRYNIQCFTRIKLQ